MPIQANHTRIDDAIKEILQILRTLPTEKLAGVRDYVTFLQASHNGALHANGYQANGNEVASEQEQIDYAILLTKQADQSYLARPVLMPELVVAGKDEDEALARVCEAITQQQTESRVVHVTLPAFKQTEDDPWLRFAGEWRCASEDGTTRMFST